MKINISQASLLDIMAKRRDYITPILRQFCSLPVRRAEFKIASLVY